MKQLIQPATLDQLIDQYNQARQRVSEGYQALMEAQEIADEHFPNRHISVVDSRIPVERAFESALGRLKQGVWRQILHQTDVRKILSIKRAKTLDENLQDPDKLPDITRASVLDYLASLRENADVLMQESVQEVFAWLRPRDGYATNDHWKVGNKVILTNVVELRWETFRVKYYYRPELAALDQVFHMLDGAGIPDGYHSPLIDAINTLPYGETGQTDYFSFQGYKNGNLHVSFKQPNLVKELNRIAGGEMVLKH